MEGGQVERLLSGMTFEQIVDQLVHEAALSFHKRERALETTVLPSSRDAQREPIHD
jgi:hypothetical protein